MHSDVLSLGYTCICGERVTLLEMTHEEPKQLPARITVSCSSGHVCTLSVKQIGVLELWADRADGVVPMPHAA